MTRGALVADRVRIARTFPQRVVGLLSRRSFDAGEAMVFPDCHSIHTVGMRFAIDVVFVSREWRVVAVRAPVPPGRMAVGAWHAQTTIELPSGAAKQAAIRVGDHLRLTERTERTQSAQKEGA